MNAQSTKGLSLPLGSVPFTLILTHVDDNGSECSDDGNCQHPKEQWSIGLAFCSKVHRHQAVAPHKKTTTTTVFCPAASILPYGIDSAAMTAVKASTSTGTQR